MKLNTQPNALTEGEKMPNPTEKMRSEIRYILKYNPETGVFYNRVDRGARAMEGSEAGTINPRHGYRQIKFKGKMHYAHRLAWLYVTGSWPVDDIDHINGDKLDNRICNLRECTHAENQANSSMQKNNKSGFKGVHWNNPAGKWVAQIGHHGKGEHLGCFDDPSEAAKAYDVAAISLKGEFAKTNAKLGTLAPLFDSPPTAA